MIRDPIREGVAAGWKAIDAAKLERDLDLEADVVVIGSGAGGGVSAEILAQAGLKVVIVEEGPLASSSDFHMREREAYAQLYQESAGRRTLDKSITLLQGRCVGGSTTVSWTSSARAPPRTLAHWRSVHGLQTMEESELAPWFKRMEERLGVAAWDMPPNANNDLLRRGCEKLGIATGALQRNVKGCANLGYCGMGCPTNAKQSMLVTTIAAALERGATLVYRARAARLVAERGRIVACDANAIAGNASAPSSRRVRIRARHFVLAAGAVGSPGILLRSAAPDPHQTLGKRTFLQPTVVSAGAMAQRVEGFYGAPQTVYSDHFLDTLPLDGAAGYRLESAPAHPVLVGITLPGFGEEHARAMAKLAHLQVALAVIRDGFHPESPGGRVVLRSDGTPVLDYVIAPYLWDAVRRAYLTLAEIQFAAGAQSVTPMHEAAQAYASWREARTAIERLPMRALAARVVSTQAAGGCGMGNDATSSVVDDSGRHHQLDNVSVHDASVFPTSIGASPQLSVCALAARFSAALGRSLHRG